MERSFDIKAITELFEYSLWGEIDFLLVDLPPGTGDETLTVGQSLPLDGVLIVTTPQDVSVIDAKRSAYAFNKLNVKNFRCCWEYELFYMSRKWKRVWYFWKGGGGEKISKYLNIPLLGKIPIEIEIRRGGDIGKPVAILNQDLKSSVEFINIAKKL